MAVRNVQPRPARVLYPRSAFRVGDLIGYYEAVASVLLPHLRGRPISFRRFPATIQDESYWEKDAPAFMPTWVKIVAVPRADRASEIHYILVEEEGRLQWADT